MTDGTESVGEFSVNEFWEDAFSLIKKNKANLSCSLMYIYKNVWNNIESKFRLFVSDNRREWKSIKLHSTEVNNYFVLEFVANTRKNVAFILQKSDEIDDCLIFRIFYMAPQKIMKSTLYPFIKSVRGAWFPYLSYGFMEDFTNHLIEKIPQARNVELKDYLINIFEKKEGKYIRHKTTRTWVDTEGNKEYDLIKNWNSNIGRVVTLKAVRIFIDFLVGETPLDIRLDHRSRIVLSTTNFDRFNQVVDLIQEETVNEFKKFKRRQKIERKSVITPSGEKIAYINYAGTESFSIKIPKSIENWFPILCSIFQNEEFMYEEENMVSFILDEELNPIVQLKLVDLDEQSSTNVTLIKDRGLIKISPEDPETNVHSVSKIYKLIEKSLGTIPRIISDVL